MKRIIYLIVAIVCSCSVFAQRIVYEPTAELEKALKKIRPKQKSKQMYIEWIYIIDSNTKQPESTFSWVTFEKFVPEYHASRNTNRYIRIGGKEYPLVMPCDETLTVDKTDYLTRTGLHFILNDGPSVTYNHQTDSITIFRRSK